MFNSKYRSDNYEKKIEKGLRGNFWSDMVNSGDQAYNIGAKARRKADFSIYRRPTVDEVIRSKEMSDEFSGMVGGAFVYLIILLIPVALLYFLGLLFNELEKNYPTLAAILFFSVVIGAPATYFFISRRKKAAAQKQEKMRIDLIQKYYLEGKDQEEALFEEIAKARYESNKIHRP